MNTTPTGSPATLPRVLGPYVATALVVGTIIGSGVFKKPQAVASALPFTGPAALVWVAAGLFTLLGALAYAEVATLHPRSGGNYVFLREGYGRLAGFLWGWVEFWIIRSASLAALATIFSESLCAILRGHFPLPPGLDLALTVAVLLGLAAINIRGVRLGGGVQVVVTAVKVASLLAIAIVPPALLLFAGADAAEAPVVTTDNLRPAWPSDITQVSLVAIGSALLAVLWPFHGWMNVAPVAGEVRDPQRNIPLALLAGVGTVLVLYLSVNFAYALVLGQEEMAALKDEPVATACGRRLFGPAGATLISVAIMISVFGSLNGNLLVGPRLLYAMGLDGLAPRALSAVHARYQTPAVAIAVLAGWAAFQVTAVGALTRLGVLEPGKSYFDRLTDFAMFGAVIFETLAVLSIFVFRHTAPDAPRPYRCPGYPLVPALYGLLPAFLLVNMFVAQPVEALAGLGFIAAGTAVYFGLGLGRRAA